MVRHMDAWLISGLVLIAVFAGYAAHRCGGTNAWRYCHHDDGAAFLKKPCALARSDDRLKTFAAGFKDHIAKPIDLDAFLSAVAAATPERV